MIEPGTKFCPNCGAVVETSLLTSTAAVESRPAAPSLPCGHCGSKIPAGVKFCPACGAIVDIPPPPPGGPAAPPPPFETARAAYGGFWIRVAAALIDGVVLNVALIPFYLVLTPFGGGIVEFAAGWLYPALMECSSRQATLGKMACGLKVTDMEGRRISFGRAAARNLAMFISAIAFCVGFIMVGLTQKKQGLHDVIAGTLVVRES
jgi:uncharacterized RDD family membrane protein YckC